MVRTRARSVAVSAVIGVVLAASACTPPSGRVINVRWGAPAIVTGCPSNCQRMVADVSGFPANSSLVVRCEYRYSATDTWRSDFGYQPPNILTDANGAATTSSSTGYCVGSPASDWEYRFVIDGTPSPALT